MVEAAVEVGRGRWSTAFALSVAVLLLPVFDALALTFVPLALLVLGLPTDRRFVWLPLGIVILALGMILVVGPLAMVSRGWALMVGAIYFAMTLAQPDWSTTSRALAAVFVAMVTGALGLSLTGQLVALDETIRTQLLSVSEAFVANLQTQFPDTPWAVDLAARMPLMADMQAQVYPALLALRTLAALALASWTVRRIRRSDAVTFRLGRLRDFRFDDNLIWLLILGLLITVSPAGPLWTRIAANLLVLMGSLYALRGLAIFVYLAEGTRSVMAMIFGALVVLLLYPVVVTGALLMGIGDTWLDVRNRPTAAG